MRDVYCDNLTPSSTPGADLLASQLLRTAFPAPRQQDQGRRFNDRKSKDLSSPATMPRMKFSLMHWTFSSKTYSNLEGQQCSYFSFLGCEGGWGATQNNNFQQRKIPNTRPTPAVSIALPTTLKNTSSSIGRATPRSQRWKERLTRKHVYAGWWTPRCGLWRECIPGRGNTSSKEKQHQRALHVWKTPTIQNIYEYMCWGAGAKSITEGTSENPWKMELKAKYILVQKKVWNPCNFFIARPFQTLSEAPS